MGLIIKVSTARTVLIGPFLDSGDGNTTEELLTIEDSDVLLSKNGGALTAKNNVSDATHDNLGYYACPLSATDTNTLGTLQLCVHMAGALPVYHEYNVVTEPDVADATLDEVIEGTVTLREAANIILAACAGKSSGGGTATHKFRDQADTKDRITATVTTHGDRTAIVNDGT